jgi:hypothetical protein
MFGHQTLHSARYERGTAARSVFGLHRNFARRTAEFIFGFRQVMTQDEDTLYTLPTGDTNLYLAIYSLFKCKNNEGGYRLF